LSGILSVTIVLQYVYRPAQGSAVWNSSLIG